MKRFTALLEVDLVISEMLLGEDGRPSTEQVMDALDDLRGDTVVGWQLKEVWEKDS